MKTLLLDVAHKTIVNAVLLFLALGRCAHFRVAAVVHDSCSNAAQPRSVPAMVGGRAFWSAAQVGMDVSRFERGHSCYISGRKQFCSGRGSPIPDPASMTRLNNINSGKRYGAGSLRSVCAVPPFGLPALGWDIGMGGACLTASVVWVNVWTGLAKRGKLKPQISRKVVHSTAAPLFMTLWPFFTQRPHARFVAAAVPFVQAIRLTVAGLSGNRQDGDRSKNELVSGISRSGRASETLGGPLKYALALVVLTAVEWRSSVIGVIAILQLAVGDGMADLIGRRFGRHKWRKGSEKSIEGSIAFATSAFLASLMLISWFHRFGALSATPRTAATRVAAISIACAAAELAPEGAVGDDNVSVPVTAMVIGRLLFSHST